MPRLYPIESIDKRSLIVIFKRDDKPILTLRREETLKGEEEIEP